MHDDMSMSAIKRTLLSLRARQFIASAARYFDLVLYKTYADLRAEVARTYISFLWWGLEPLIQMLIFYLVFAVFLKAGTPNFVAFLLIGLTVWKWFDSTIRHSAGAIVDNVPLMRQVYLPKALFPLITVMTDTAKFLIVLLLLLCFLAAYGAGPTSTWIALPGLLLLQAIFTVGVSFVIAALVPFIPDVRVLLDSAMLVLMFASGIFYDPKEILGVYQSYFFLNPMASLIQAYRDVLLLHRWPDMIHLAAVGILAVLTLSMGVAMLKRFDRVYPKIA